MRQTMSAVCGVVSGVAISAAALAPAGAGTASAQEVLTYRSGIDLVNMGVTVTDRRGELVTDLTIHDFVIDEDGIRQARRSTACGEK